MAALPRRSSSSSTARHFASTTRNQSHESPNTLSLLGVNISLGQPHLGTDRAPELMRANGITGLIADCDWRLHQMHDVNEKQFPIPDNLKKVNARNHFLMGKNLELVSQTLDSTAASDNFVLIIGGDHSISMGTIPPLVKARGKTGVIWVDAHADINTPDGSPSGNMHGMSLAFLLGLAKTTDLPSFQWLQPCINPEDIVYVGLRDLDSSEKDAIRNLGIKAYTMHDIDKYGIGEVMKQATEYLGNHKNLHLSFDIDAIDPFFAPHTGTAVRGGLTFREANYVCEELWQTGKLTSMELVEVNDAIQTDQGQEAKNSTIQMAMTLVGSAIGQKIL